MIISTFKKIPELSLFVISFLIITSSCSKFEGDQTVPAYIRIDTIGLKINHLSEGSNSVDVSDAWIFVDDQLVGAFELPCMVPALHQGSCKVTIKPGIKLNGLINLRSAFPIFKDITTQVRLTPDSITTFGTVIIGNQKVLYTSYSAETEFKLTEAFEDPVLAFDTTIKSQVSMVLTTAGSPDTFEGDHSGVVTLADSTTYFEMYSREEMPLPGAGTPVFLEMNYKTSIPVTIGVYAFTNTSVVQHPVMVLTSMPEWKKIYINLTPIVSSTSDALTYKVFIGASRNLSDPAGSLFIDNVKVIHL